MTTENLEASHEEPISLGSSSAPRDSDCDLVMKGGITSGVIYPRLVAQLSKRYRFRNIGGTSAGAIAAGACAAAEFRRTNGNDQGFEDLAKLPDELNDKSNPTGRTKLFTLFQPTPALRPHFAVLERALNKKPAAAAVAMAGGMLRAQYGLVLCGLVLGALLLAPFFVVCGSTTSYWQGVLQGAGCLVLVAFAATRIAQALAGGGRRSVALWSALALLIPGIALAWASGWRLGFALTLNALGAAVACLMVLSLLVLAAAVRFLAGLVSGLHANGYGCCSGQTPADGSTELPALTDWLANYLNKLAGLPLGGDPLTFGHLWGTTDPDAPRHINLEVMTSAISQQMVYSIPFRPGTPVFFYDPVEWGRLFPASVMQWLDRSAAMPSNGSSESIPEGVSVQNAAGRNLKPLPQRADLPVVVAVRMSLSFPVLLSAVPLYCIDWSRTQNQQCKRRIEERLKRKERVNEALTATRIWFSDGGIGSNMPLHMFDSLLPGHPTFAVNLKAEHPDFQIVTPERSDNSGGRIYLPVNNQGGGLRHWPEPDDGKPVGGLIGFLLGIVDTMQNWRDEILFPYPGFRDRIVQISQRSDEGGLNLDMPTDSITALANAGMMAADRLIDRFHQSGAEAGGGWRNHQVVRLRTFLGITQPAMAGLCDTLENGPWKGYAATVASYGGAQGNLAQEFIEGAARLGALGQGKVSLEKGALKPLAQIRITPRI